MPAEGSVRAAEVAAEIRRRLPNVGDVKLHKLLYYIQGYHLVWEEAPAFADTIEAWDWGPVVANYWREQRYSVEASDYLPVSESICNVITYVLRNHGSATGQSLIKATHSEDPWKDVTDNGNWIANQEITHESLADFFSRETPYLIAIREAVYRNHDPDEPFVPDGTEALATLKHLTK